MTPAEIETAFAKAIADAGLGDAVIPPDGRLHRPVLVDNGRQRTQRVVLHAEGVCPPSPVSSLSRVRNADDG